MSESPINITLLNDFIFCPASIYFHSLDNETEKVLYQSEYQLKGSAAHETVDSASYSTRSDIWQGREVYCERFDLFGKIDLFFASEGKLVERKNKVSTIYDGYIFQLYAQYFALAEMGETVKKLVIHSIVDNKSYAIERPEENPEMMARFEKTISEIRRFSLDHFSQENSEKCKRCIYNPLCSFATSREVNL